MAIHDENVNDPCPVCRKLWPSEHDLIRHLDVMHNEYFEANFEALNEMRIKEMQNMSLPYGKLCCDPELFDDNEVNHPVSLNDCSPPTDIKNKETQQMPGGINSSFFSETFTPSKRSESVRKHVSTASLDQDLGIASNNSRNAPSTSFHQMPSYLPHTSNVIMNAGLKDAADDILKESITQRTCFTILKKTTIIKKMVNTQLPSINQFQKDCVISAATAQPPKVIGKNLNCFQKLNTPKDIDIVVPVNHRTVNFNSKCLKESHVKDSSTPNLTTPYVVALEKLNLTPPESEPKKIKSAANTTTIKEKKEFDAIIKSSIEEILKEDGIQDKKEQIKRENILRKCLLKWEEKEEMKLVKYFQKIFFSYFKKRKANLNEMEKKVFNTVEDKTKLLKVIRNLNCKDQSDVGQLIKYFNIKVKPAKHSPVNEKQKPGIY